VKKHILLLALCVVIAGSAGAVPNPSAVYCIKCGYQYQIRTDSTGGQYGVCVFPDGSECEAWTYYRKCNWPQNCSDCDCPWHCPTRIIYVDDHAKGANNGTSWQDAYEYLQDALADANLSAKPVEIRVAQGIYSPDRGAGRKPTDQGAAFQLMNGVAIKGGYAGLDARDPNARDIARHETILSGDLNGNDVDVNDPLDLLHEPSRAENSEHVVIASGTDATAILDAFTITGGNFTAISDHSPSGGAGIFNDSGSPMLISCTFTKNAISQMGAGMYNKNGSSPVLINCIFSKNWAGDGGAMVNYLNSSPRLTNCTFVHNSAYSGSNGISSWNNSTPRLTNCILWDNGGSDESSQIRGQTSTVNYCCIQGWTGDLGGIGNMSADPCFTDPYSGDLHVKSQAGRWDPKSQTCVKDDVTSPCIDTGDPMSPIGHEPFPNGGRINMGAYGGTGEASKSYFGELVCETIVAGDINGDCKVDFADFAIMALHWLEDNSF
jgi:putative hemolysin